MNADKAVRRRLRPLHLAIWLQGVLLWVPVEKLFMSEIGFDAASVGLMAAAYAAVVPLLEIPSGILADRWSRRGVLIFASIALVLNALIGGLSTNVPTYIASAMLLGVYFAMYSGTVEAIVYDVVIEETGDSELYQRRIGRVHVIDSVALVSSSLAGGVLAELTSPRLMYFLSIPFAALSIVFYLRFREPGLHRANESTPLRGQIALTFRTITQRGRLLPIVALTVLTALLLQVIFEFGPLWLVALAAPAVLYGPYWAGLVSTFGIAGMLAGKLRMDRAGTLVVITGLSVAACLTLSVSNDILVVAVAQIVLALLVVMASIYVSQLLHDAVPSTIRAGVASGTSTISWIIFLPFSLLFGLISKHSGVHTANWMITVTVALVMLVLWRVSGHVPLAHDSDGGDQEHGQVSEDHAEGGPAGQVGDNAWGPALAYRGGSDGRDQ
jgi:MFS family permease